MTWISAINWSLVLEWTGAALAILGMAMKTIIPLRFIGIAGNTVGLISAATAMSPAGILANLVLLPVNSWRLVQMLRLIKRVKKAGEGDLSMEWLKPYMSRRTVKAGDVLFAKGDQADCMFYTVSGHFHLRQLGIDVLPGRLVGEMGFLSPDNCRTQTLECLKDGEVLSITYNQLRELYFQNPEFGFYFLRLVSERMFNNMQRLENELSSLRSGAEVASERPANANPEPLPHVMAAGAV